MFQVNNTSTHTHYTKLRNKTKSGANELRKKRRKIKDRIIIGKKAQTIHEHLANYPLQSITNENEGIWHYLCKKQKTVNLELSSKGENKENNPKIWGSSLIMCVSS